MVGKNARCELGPAIGFPLVACVGGEKGDSWRGAMYLLEEVGEEVGFMGVMKSCNRW